MKQVTPARLAMALWALSVLLTIAACVLIAANESAGDTDPLLDIVGLLTALTFATVGAVVASRRASNPIGWILLGAGLVSQLEDCGGAYAFSALNGVGPSLPGGVAVAVIADSLWLPGVALSLVYLFLLFPDGRLLSTRWRSVFIGASVLSIASIPLTIVDPGPLYFAPEIDNPFGIGSAVATIEAAQGVIIFGMGAVIIAALVGLVVRIRRSRGDERRQMKWFVFAASLVVAVVPVAVIFNEHTVAPLMLEAAPTSMSIAIGVAVLKYRLYDIDRLISRTLAYAVLTALLVGGYLLAVLALQSVLPVNDDSPVIVAASTLGVVAAFGPLRTRIQSAVDHRFNRNRYDASVTIERFSTRLRDEVDLEALTTDLVGVIESTMQPRHVSVWLAGTGERA